MRATLRYTQTSGAMVETYNTLDGKPSGQWVLAVDYDQLERELAAIKSEDSPAPITRSAALTSTPRTDAMWAGVSDEFGLEFARQLERELADVTLAHHRALAAIQARIDALMLEYWPEEMTPEQTEEWARHQKPVASASALSKEKP